MLTGVEEVDKLFTAILLWAKQKWRQRTENSACGIDLEDGDAKLLDLRFADDLLLFARTNLETIFMLETLMDLFFFSSLLFPQPSLVQTVLLVSLQANETHEGQNSRAHATVCGSGGSPLEGVGRPGLRPGFGSSWDDSLQRCKDLGWLRREGWLKGGHGCTCQGGGPACSESGCNALLEDGRCLSRFGSC